MSEQTETDAAINAINHSIEIIKSVALKTRNIEYDETLNKTKYYGHSNFEEVNVFGKPVALKEDIDNIKTDAITQDIKTVIINEETGEEEEITETKTLTELLDSKANVNHTHSISDVIDYIEPDLTPYAKSDDIANSITTKKINVNTTLDNGFPVEVRRNATLAKNKYIRYLIGDNTAQALFGYGHDGSNVPFLYIKLYQKNAEIDVYSDSIKLVGQTSCNNILTATNITADNETRLAAVETYTFHF